MLDPKLASRLKREGAIRRWALFDDTARLEKAMEKIEPIPESGCWIWMGTINENGYGRLRTESGRTYAHRFFYERLVGPVPDGLCVLHRCDVPSCVNPSHHFLGDRKENMLDMWSKGRGIAEGRSGEAHGMAKVTEEQVRDIRKREFAAQHYADLYGVKRRTIYAIWGMEKWAHVL